MLSTSILILFTIALFWFCNKVMLIRYYEHTKIKMLANTFTKVNDISNQIKKKNEATQKEQEGIFYDENNNKIEESELAEEENDAINDEIALALERLGSNQNMDLYVFHLYSDGYQFYFEDIYPKMTNLQRNVLFSRIIEFYTNDSANLRGKTLLKSGKQYNVYKVFDQRIDSNYIELFGKLKNGATIYIRTNLESIQENVWIANRFLGYVAVIAILFGIFVMFFLSKTFTTPILQLAHIAKKISDLDFDVKYPVTTKDEIGILGTSINRLAEKLEKTISELKTANNELQTDIARKVQIDEMRQEFLSNVSHELKTPIALIQGYAEGLKENINEDIESKDFYCDVIQDEANKMNKLVAKLLTLNQIEFGKNEIVFERFDLTALIRTVLNSTEILFQQKKIEVIFQQKKPIYVWADEYMIEEIVTNYISNALHYVKGEKKIIIRIWNEQDRVYTSVFNTGDPIPDTELDQIWLKFYKVDKARTREYGGSGIGLSIVKAVVTALNQECGVKNEKDGVTFWFTLDAKV